MILECSSKGDRRFSAFYAKVIVDGRFDSIENHYQLAKRFGDEVPKTWRDAKGRKPTHFEVEGKKYPVEKLTAFYDLLWFNYLENNPDLVEVLLRYDGYHDSFARKGANNQAESIARYLKKKGLR